MKNPFKRDSEEYPFKKIRSNKGRDTLIGLLVFVAICIIASWLGEKMHGPEDSHGGPGSYLEEACPDCNQQ